MLNLTRREADIAVRPTRRPPETLAGRRIASLASAVYGAAGTAAEDPHHPQQRWVAWEEGGGPPLVARWFADRVDRHAVRSEEHTSELQSLMRISYAVFCLKKKTQKTQQTDSHTPYNEQ